MKWPFVKRSTMETKIKELNKQFVNNLNIETGSIRRQERERYTLEIDKATKMIDELVKRFIKIRSNLTDPSQLGIYKVEVHFTRDFVNTAFIHGNSQEEIRYISERLAYMVQRELATLNFERLR